MAGLKIQIPNSKLQTNSKPQSPMTETILFGILVIGAYLEFGLPARSPASRSLAEGRRSGEGRCLRFGA